MLREWKGIGGRLVQLAWLPACLREIESDLSAFHRIDSLQHMDGLRFVQFAELLPSYRGAVAALFRMVTAQHRDQLEQQSRDAVHHPDAADLFG